MAYWTQVQMLNKKCSTKNFDKPVTHISSTAKSSNFHSSLKNENSREKIIENFKSRRQNLKKNLKFLK